MANRAGWHHAFKPGAVRHPFRNTVVAMCGTRVFEAQDLDSDDGFLSLVTCPRCRPLAERYLWLPGRAGL